VASSRRAALTRTSSATFIGFTFGFLNLGPQLRQVMHGDDMPGSCRQPPYRQPYRGIAAAADVPS
jgi:hypothetical protein